MPALVLFAKARVEFLRCNVNSGLDRQGPTFAKLSGDASKAICQQLMCTRAVPAEDATEIITMIGASFMCVDDQTCVRDCVNGKVDVDESKPAGNGTQEHAFFSETLTELDWTKILKGNIAISLQVLAKRSFDQGLFHPSETLVRHIVSIGFWGAGDTGGPSSVNQVREFKTNLRNLISVQAQKIHKDSLPSAFTSLEEFKVQSPLWYNSAYPDMPPVPCKAPVADLLAIQANIACRSTRAGCAPGPTKRARLFATPQQAAAPIAAPIAVVGASSQPEMLAMMQQCMQMMSMMTRNGAPPGVSLQFVGQRAAGGMAALPAPPSESASSAAAVTQAALMDTEATLPQESKLAIQDGVVAPAFAIAEDSNMKMVMEMQRLLGGKAAGADDTKEITDEAEPAAEITDEAEPAPTITDKAEPAPTPVAQGTASGKAKAKAKAKPKGAAKAKGKAAAKPKGKAKGAAKAEAALSPKDPTMLEFPGTTKKFAPRQYGKCTIYCGFAHKCWRLKLNPGDKHERWFRFRNMDQKGAKKVWNDMVNVCKTHS